MIFMINVRKTWTKKIFSYYYETLKEIVMPLITINSFKTRTKKIFKLIYYIFFSEKNFQLDYFIFICKPNTIKGG